MSYNIPSDTNSSNVPGNLSPADLSIGERIKSASPGDDLQALLDALNATGGGTLNLFPGTFQLSANLTVYSNIKIQGVGSNTTTIDFQNGAFSIKVIGTSMNPLSSVFFQGFAVYNSSTDLISVNHINTFEVSDIQCFNGASGFNVNDANILALDKVLVAACSQGILLSNSTNISNRDVVVSTTLTGDGLYCDTITVAGFNNLSVDSTTGRSLYMTGCSNLGFTNISFTNSGSIGVELSSCEGFSFYSPEVGSCVSDGIKLEGCTSISIDAAEVSDNGGYGINVSNVGCIDTIILGNRFSTNSSGNVHDLGTGTLIRSNIGVVDN